MADKHLLASGRPAVGPRALVSNWSMLPTGDQQARSTILGCVGWSKVVPHWELGMPGCARVLLLYIIMVICMVGDGRTVSRHVSIVMQRHENWVH